MKSEGLKGLVLDLRNNPGGLLDAAVSVAENFVAKEELIVSTKGRSDESKREYHSNIDPILGSLPLVVLVNEYSASASEIVSGAVQDLDRGVVMGTSTFGKGLVQTVVPITRDAALKITTAKYYIPSGRLIQRPDRQYSQATNSVLDFVDELDKAPSDSTSSDSVVYHTVRNKREVYGGGGIKPDIIVKAPPVSRYEFELRRKSMLFQFALIYVSQHKDEIKPNFEVDDRMLAEFRSFLKDKNFSYVSESEEALVEFKKAAEAEGYLGKLDDKISLLENALDVEKDDDFDKNSKVIIGELKKEIAAKRFGTRAKVETGFENDPVLREALNVLKNQKRYTGILSNQQESKG